MTDQQLDLDAITAMHRAQDTHEFVAEVRRLRAELAAPTASDVLRGACVAALDEAHHTHPCPVTGHPYWSGCVHPDGRGTSCHSERRADEVLAVRDTGQFAKKDAHGGDNEGAPRAFLGADGTAELAAADNPTQLRWGLDDVLWGDDDTVTVLLSGPQREPYWLELGKERAAALRQNLTRPGQDETADGPSTAQAETQQAINDELRDTQQ